MAGKTITLTRAVRHKGKLHPAGSKIQVDAATYQELVDVGAVEAKDTDDSKDEAK